MVVVGSGTVVELVEPADVVVVAAVVVGAWVVGVVDATEVVVVTGSRASSSPLQAAASMLEAARTTTRRRTEGPFRLGPAKLADQPVTSMVTVAVGAVNGYGLESLRTEKTKESSPTYPGSWV